MYVQGPFKSECFEVTRYGYHTVCPGRIVATLPRRVFKPVETMLEGICGKTTQDDKFCHQIVLTDTAMDMHFGIADGILDCEEELALDDRVLYLVYWDATVYVCASIKADLQ